MQTFLISKDVKETAKALDYRRLGKQRREAVQIARALLGMTEGYKNHAATRMWRGYESYLVKVYLKAMMDEWASRGYSNAKTEEDYEILIQHVGDDLTEPEWFTEEFFTSHKSNLVRKKPEFYRDKFPNVREDLEYVWPA